MTALSQYSAHFFQPDATNNSWSNMYGYIPAGARVLDVGCSTGNFGAALEGMKQCTVVGVDISSRDIAEAKKQISEAYVFDITADGARELLGTFDVVVFADVIEHLADPRAALSAVHELLNPGGLIVYSIPNMGHLSVRLDVLDGRFPYTELGLLDRTHLHFYDRLEVQDVLGSAGFAITDEKPTTSRYPERWVAERLGGVGLQTSPAFFSMLDSTDAYVYQFVGTAVPRAGIAGVPRVITEELTPPEEVLRYAERVAAENDRLLNELRGLHARFASFRRNPMGGIFSELRLALRRRRQ